MQILTKTLSGNLVNLRNKYPQQCTRHYSIFGSFIIWENLRVGWTEIFYLRVNVFKSSKMGKIQG